MDYSPPGFSVYGILQARILEGVAISSSRGSSQPRDQTQVSCIADRFLILWTTREAMLCWLSCFYEEVQLLIWMQHWDPPFNWKESDVHQLVLLI